MSIAIAIVINIMIFLYWVAYKAKRIIRISTLGQACHVDTRLVGVAHKALGLL
jgi:hypothetical protein